MIYVGATLIIEHATHTIVDDGVESAVAPKQWAQPFGGIFACDKCRIGGLVSMFAQVISI